MTRALILGARQHAQVIADVLTRDYELIGYLDDKPDLQGKTLERKPVLGKLGDLEGIVDEYRIEAAFLGISARHIKVRESMQRVLEEKGLLNGNVIHDAAYISSKASMGHGNFLAPYAVVNAYASISNNCVLYSGAVVEHHTNLKDNVYMGPNASLAADIIIGENTYIGAGATVTPHVKVGKNVTLGAGTVIIEDIPDNAVVVGVPGKVIKFKK